MSIILTIVLSVVSATAGSCHYCDYVSSTTTLVTESKRDYYGGDMVFLNDTLEMVLTPNGYVDSTGCYYFYIKDYQGNIRLVVDRQGNVIEQNDYYPYGGLFGESASRQSYKYSGKELEQMNGLNSYDFHARQYAYPLSQFHSPDILSEKYYHVSPYLYCLGNPIKYTDPTGNYIESAWDVFSMMLGVNSLCDNVKKGDVGAAIVDGLGVAADVVAIILPVIPGGASAMINGARVADDVVDATQTTSKAEKTFQTYTKTNKETNEVYVGRTSGTGNPYDNVKKRDQNHHMNKKGYGEAQLDKTSNNPDAIRGQEQTPRYLNLQ